MDDAERGLIERAQAGEESALVELYQRHYAPIHDYFAYRLADPAIADDLSAEVFERMVRHLGSFQLRGRPLLSWLYTIARNLLAEHHRRNGQVQILSLSEHLPSREPDPEVSLEEHLSSQALARALSQLTEAQQQVIIARFVEGRPIAEVAAILERTEGSIKALQFRALAALQRALAKEEQHGSI